MFCCDIICELTAVVHTDGQLCLFFIRILLRLLLYLAGLQVIFPDYLQEKFVQSALSYIMCNGEGEYICHDNRCICQCADEYPQCNCPFTDIQIMENTLLGMSEAWASSYKDFEASGKAASCTNMCHLCWQCLFHFNVWLSSYWLEECTFSLLYLPLCVAAITSTFPRNK